jgi:hypothetical protein
MRTGPRLPFDSGWRDALDTYKDRSVILFKVGAVGLLMVVFVAVLGGSLVDLAAVLGFVVLQALFMSYGFDLRSLDGPVGGLRESLAAGVRPDSQTAIVDVSPVEVSEPGEWAIGFNMENQSNAAMIVEVQRVVVSVRPAALSRWLPFWSPRPMHVAVRVPNLGPLELHSLDDPNRDSPRVTVRLWGWVPPKDACVSTRTSVFLARSHDGKRLSRTDSPWVEMDLGASAAALSQPRGLSDFGGVASCE